jgi:hypothetical protein
MMLSIPNTISKNVSVNKLIILSTVSNDSINLFFSCKDGVFQADNQRKRPLNQKKSPFFKDRFAYFKLK